MSQYGAELHMYIIGERRTDGWRSPWRIEQERRRAEEMGQRQFVKAKPTIQRSHSDPDRRREIVRKSVNKTRARLLAQGLCRECHKNQVKDGRTSCSPCLKARYQRQKRKRAELKRAA